MSQNRLTELGESRNPALSLESLPKSAIQAIYHAVTGKTENYRKQIDGNVFIDFDDIERLHSIVLQQLEHYEVVAGPTTTIVIKDGDSKTYTYSSWERFKVFEINTVDVTSEINIKYEFVTRLPNTETPQRCVINITLDSALPVLKEARKSREYASLLGILFMERAEWRTVKTSVDFVDFLIAKVFVAHIEEWFTTLKKTPEDKLNAMLAANLRGLAAVFSESGRLGAAAFVIGFAVFSGVKNTDLTAVGVGAGITLALWAFIAILSGSMARTFQKRISQNIVPSVILMTKGDRECYAGIRNDINNSGVTLIRVLGSPLVAIGLNLAASYIYAWLVNS
jgi:hypothetical protein